MFRLVVTLQLAPYILAFSGGTGSCKGGCEDHLGPCKRQCTVDYPPTLAEWNAMCEAGNGVFGSMPSVEVCKERGAEEYAGASGKNSPMGNCKGRCEDEVPRCKARCDDDSLPSCKAKCSDDGGYAPRPDGKEPMWEGDVGSCKNQCHRFYNSPTYQ